MRCPVGPPLRLHKGLCPDFNTQLGGDSGGESRKSRTGEGGLRPRSPARLSHTDGETCPYSSSSELCDASSRPERYMGWERDPVQEVGCSQETLRLVDTQARLWIRGQKTALWFLGSWQGHTSLS